MNVHVNLPHIAEIAADLAQYEDDPEAFWDTLDGETDAGEILDALLREDTQAKAHAAALAAVIKQYQARKSRLEKKAKSTREWMRKLLSAAGQAKAVRPLGTVSITSGRTSVSIVNEREVPTQLMRVKREPDLTAIKKALEAGEAVPGCELTSGKPTVTVRNN